MMIPEPSAFKSFFGAVAHLIWMPMQVAASCLVQNEPSEETREYDRLPYEVLLPFAMGLSALLFLYAWCIPYVVTLAGLPADRYCGVIKWSVFFFHDLLGASGSIFLFLAMLRSGGRAICSRWKDRECPQWKIEAIEVGMIFAVGSLLLLAVGSLFISVSSCCYIRG